MFSIQTLTERAMNDRWRKSRQRQDLSASGIVAKEQGPSRCAKPQNKTNFKIGYCLSLCCSFVTIPDARVCAGFASDYSWSGSIKKTPRPLLNYLDRYICPALRVSFLKC
jgi:hypothetical protein